MSQDSAAEAPSFAVVISSCDAYCDLWPYFFHFFFKHWPSAPQPVYLISNERRYNDPRVQSILVGPDKQWGSNTREAVSRIDAEVMMVLLDDFFFDAPFPEDTFQKALHQFNTVGGKLLEMRLHAVAGEAVEDTWFRRADPSNLCAGINSNLWRRELLIDIARPGLNIWQCESLVRQKLREGERNFLFMDQNAPKQISFVEGVRGRFWKPEGLAYMRANGIQPDLKWRPCPPQGEGFLAKLVRSYHKRRMNRLRSRPQAPNLTDVQPLPSRKS